MGFQEDRSNQNSGSDRIAMNKRIVHGRARLKPVKPTYEPKLGALPALQGQQMSLPPPKVPTPSRVEQLREDEDIESSMERAPSFIRELSSVAGKQTKTNPYLSFINAAPRVEKTFATKESLQRTAKLTVDRTAVLRRQRNRTVRFQASHSPEPAVEEIKVPEPLYSEVSEEEGEDIVEEDEIEDIDGGEIQLIEADEDEVSVVFEFGTYDIIEPLEEETENISPTEIPVSIIPKYNAALAKLREQNTLPEAETVKAGESLVETARKTKKVTKPPAPKPKPKPAPPPPAPPKPPPQQPPAPVKVPPKQVPPKPPAKVSPPKPVPKPKAKPIAPPPPKPKPPPPPPPQPPPKVQKAPPKPKEKAPLKPVPVKKTKPIVIRTETPDDQVTEFLPISGPDDHLSELESNHEDEQEEVKRSRSPIKKKERVERKAPTPEPQSASPALLSPPPFVHNKRGSIQWGTDDEGETEDKEEDNKSEKSDVSVISVEAHVPDLPTLNLEGGYTRKQRAKHALQLDNISSPRKGPKSDPDYEAEQRRLALAEQRRRKQQQLYNKLRSRGRQMTRMESDASSESRSSFDDYDFLSKYCIFHQGSIEMYRQAFEAVDDEERGWLSEEETAIALRGVNNKLSGVEEEFLFRIIEMTGYSISHGADFRLFSVLAALSHRISALDSWMKLMISDMNFKLLEMKTFLCKELWEICVDPDTKRITIDQMIIELRSGGISRKHEEAVKEKLGHFTSMDLLDFLTYSPLFVMIHQSVIDNPLSQDRDK